MNFPHNTSILLPSGFNLSFHTTDFVTQTQNSILAVMNGGVQNEYTQFFSAREGRIVHKKIPVSVHPNSLVLELSIANEYIGPILGNTLNVNEVFGSFCRQNWTHVYKLFPIERLKYTDLYRSTEEVIEYVWKKWKVKFWFCASNVNCWIHNEHNFIEWHIGIVGDGRMEKFTDFDEKTLIESWRMSPGQAHPIFAFPEEKDENGNPKYPPHRWFGGNTGDLWMVVEEFF